MDPIIILLIGAAIVVLGITTLKLHAVLSLLLAAFVTALLTTPEQILEYAEHAGMTRTEAIEFSGISIGRRIAAGFGNTCGKIGILITLASIIGTALMRSGGAERIVRGLLGLFGKKNTSLALVTGSFTLAIPVFFDTVFYLMLPLVKSIGVRNPRKFGLYLMAVMAGGVMAHSLVPPTPGPLFVAEEMGIDLGTMIIGGLIIGVITVAGGYVYSLWANRRWDLPMRDTPDIRIEDLKQISSRDNKNLPGLFISLLPILLPILLITGHTVLNMVYEGNPGTPGIFMSGMMQAFSLLGDPNVALALSAVIAIYLLWRRLHDAQAFKKFMTESISSAAMIILITSAGGAFGQILQQTSIGIRVSELAANHQVAILPLAFFITAAVRTAQGSATIAMVTAIGIMGGLGEGGLQYHPVYLAMAIGCGSKIFAWMNDSAFWIITKMSGMIEQETIRHFSLLLTFMGVTGLVAIMILARIFPLI